MLILSLLVITVILFLLSPHWLISWTIHSFWRKKNTCWRHKRSILWSGCSWLAVRDTLRQLNNSEKYKRFIYNKSNSKTKKIISRIHKVSNMKLTDYSCNVHWLNYWLLKACAKLTNLMINLTRLRECVIYSKVNWSLLLSFHPKFI